MKLMRELGTNGKNLYRIYLDKEWWYGTAEELASYLNVSFRTFQTLSYEGHIGQVPVRRFGFYYLAENKEEGFSYRSSSMEDFADHLGYSRSYIVDSIHRGREVDGMTLSVKWKGIENVKSIHAKG